MLCLKQTIMKTIVSLIFCFLTIGRINAQVSDKANSSNATNTLKTDKGTTWMNTGFGTSSIGISYFGEIAHQRDHFLTSFRISGNNELLWGDNIWDAGALFGVAADPGRWHFSVAAGPGLVGGKHQDLCIFCSENKTTAIPVTIAMPVELQMNFNATKHFGIGLYGFADVNYYRNFYGLALAFQVGRIR